MPEGIMQFTKLIVEIGGGEEKEIQLQVGATLGQLAASGVIPKLTAGASYFINGGLVTSSYVVRDGDRLAVQAKSGTQG